MSNIVRGIFDHNTVNINYLTQFSGAHQALIHVGCVTYRPFTPKNSGRNRTSRQKSMKPIRTFFFATALLAATPLLAGSFSFGLGQNGTPTTDTVLRTTGVAVSPSRLRMAGEPGETITKRITITNDTEAANSFKLSFQDFNMNGYGKSSFLPAGEGQYSLAKWASISPSFVELKPFEKREVTLTLTLPDNEAARRAAWSILMVEQTAEKRSLDIPDPGSENVAFGVIPTFAFGVFLYQNPPNVLNNSVEFTDFRLDLNLEEQKQKQTEQAPGKLTFTVENTGDGISYCTAYIELTNLHSGTQERMPVKHFTILPNLIRDFEYFLPPGLGSGKYSAVAVLDFGHEAEIQAAEMEFEIAPH